MTGISEIRQLCGPVSRLVLPVLVEQVFIAAMGIVNTILAARLGRETISAIGMVDAISTLIIAFFGALAIGGTVTVAQFIGRSDRQNANRTAAQALISGLMIAVTVTLLIFFFRCLLINTLYGKAEPLILDLSVQYLSIVLWSFIPIAIASITFGILRGAGDTRTPMLVSILMNGANVILSLVLIYGISINLGFVLLETPALGIRGAAIGLLSARTLGMLLGLVPLFRGSKLIRLASLYYFQLKPELLRCIFRLGIPATTEILFFQIGKLIVQTLVVSLGTTVIAATAIANSVLTLLVTPGGAMSIAAMTLVGQNIGRGKPAEAKRQLKFLIVTASVAIGIVSLITLPFLNGLIGLYSNNPVDSQLTRQILLSLLIVQPLFWSMSFITPAGLRSAGDVRYTMAVALSSMALLRVFLAYAFTMWLSLGGLGIWLAMYCDWIGRSIFFIRRIKGKRWYSHDILSRKTLIREDI